MWKSHMRLIWDLGNDEKVFTYTFIFVSSCVPKCPHAEYILFLIVFLTSFPDKTKVVSFPWKHARKYIRMNLGYNSTFHVTDHRWNTLIIRNREKAVMSYCKYTVKVYFLSTDLIFISYLYVYLLFSRLPK